MLLALLRDPAPRRASRPTSLARSSEAAIRDTNGVSLACPAYRRFHEDVRDLDVTEQRDGENLVIRGRPRTDVRHRLGRAVRPENPDP